MMSTECLLMILFSFEAIIVSIISTKTSKRGTLPSVSSLMVNTIERFEELKYNF